MGEPTETQTAAQERRLPPWPTGSVTGRQGSDGADHTRGTQGLRARLRERRHFPGSPRLAFELLLIGVSYWLYSLVRNAVPEQEAAAQHHAREVWNLEHHLGLTVEKSVNQALNSVTWLITGMNYYYATLHFVVTIGVLVWVFRRHPGRYRAIRTALFLTTGVALVGFYFFPLAPPRLMAGAGFIDTVKVHHTWGSMASGDMAHVSNQYAAMPSMHIGWSLWCGLTIAFLTRRWWARVLGLLYPVATLVVIVATANHFLLDAVGGAACLGAGFTASRVLYHRWAFRLPRLPEPRRPLPAGPVSPTSDQPRVPVS